MSKQILQNPSQEGQQVSWDSISLGFAKTTQVRPGVSFVHKESPTKLHYLISYKEQNLHGPET